MDDGQQVQEDILDMTCIKGVQRDRVSHRYGTRAAVHAPVV